MGLVESIEELDELNSVVPISVRVKLDESVKGLDELIRQIVTMSSHGTRQVRRVAR